MKFLVILVCVTLNYFWSRDLDRIKDTWFFILRQRIDNLATRLEQRNASAWVLGLLLIFLLPLALLVGTLIAIDGVLYGFLTMLVHIFILLMAFDRIHPGLLAQRYLERWRAGDFEGCFLCLIQELACRSMPIPGDYRQLHSTFSRLYVYRCFEKMFVMFFWYIVAGPIGVMFAYICYQHRDGDARMREKKEARVVQKLIELLEWAPLRLLGFTFSLVGDFECCFDRLKKTGMINQLAADVTVHEYSICALGLNPPVAAQDNGNAEASREDGEGRQESKAGDAFSEQAALEVEALRALMERSQVIWLCCIALITVFGLGL